jgi:hypothetical protein
MRPSLPWRLVILHTVLMPFFMFTLWKRWFVTDIPFDCFYVPFFVTSGPLVYFVAHYFQHFSERFFSADASVMLPWNLVPGLICLILGGIQWWLVGRLWIWWRSRRLHIAVADGARQV